MKSFELHKKLLELRQFQLKNQNEKVDALLIELKSALPESTQELDDFLAHCKQNDTSILLPYAKLIYAAEHNGIAAEHAEKLITIFPDVNDAFKYLNKMIKPDLNHPVHDACLFVIPQNIDLETWSELSKKCMTDDDFRKNILPQAAIDKAKANKSTEMIQLLDERRGVSRVGKIK